MNDTYTPSFPKILTVPSIESCAELSALKNEPAMKKHFDVSTIFSSSRKISSTFHKVLQEKQMIMPARHSDYVSYSFARII